MNDEIPQFTDPAYLSVLEGKPIGTEVGQLHALDKDSTPPFNEVRMFFLIFILLSTRIYNAVVCAIGLQC